MAIALLSGSVGLLGDALHNRYDVSTSAVVFAGSGFIVHVGWRVTSES
jgi:divalent metal cation (Fe/Co/Zn/Cd) transporter